MTTALKSFEPDAPTAEIAATLRADGGVIIRRLASEDLMDEVYAEVDRNTTVEQQKSGGVRADPRERRLGNHA